MGLPAHEVPAVEIARGDLVEVVPASYGVHSRAFHFWSGPGRDTGGNGPEANSNFYENLLEATQGKKKADPVDPVDVDLDVDLRADNDSPGTPGPAGSS